MRKVFLGFFSLLLLALLSVFIADYVIKERTQDKLYTDIAAVPIHKVGVVLGTVKTLSSGYENPYFTNRIIAASKLYKEKKINYIVVSGDNSRVGYNEPEDMKVALMERGVPEVAIYLDYAGFRTLDSMVRMREIFTTTSFIVISQAFHNERAVYIGNHFGLDVIGFNAQDVSKAFGIKTMLREKLARVKVFVDILFNQQPKFLGKQITIGLEE